MAFTIHMPHLHKQAVPRVKAARERRLPFVGSVVLAVIAAPFALLWRGSDDGND